MYEINLDNNLFLYYKKYKSETNKIRGVLIAISINLKGG